MASLKKLLPANVAGEFYVDPTGICVWAMKGERQRSVRITR